jgi:hypothetical protein
VARTVGDGGWSWFGDPRAVYFAGRHRRTVLKRGLSIDDHNSPGLLMRANGRLTVFYLGPSRAHMLYRRSSNAEDVASWGPEHTLPTNTPGHLGYTYPNPVYLSAEKRTYLFWRGAQWWPAFSRHSERGDWTPARTLLRIPDQRPYLKFHTDGVRHIHIAYTEGNAGSFVNSVYYLRYRGDAFHRADGTRVAGIRGLPLAPSEGDRVYDARASGVRAWVWDIAARRDGRPVIVYALFPDGSDCIYMYAEWTSGRWQNHAIVAGGGRIGHFYAPGISLDHENPNVVYLSRKVRGRFVVQRWRTADNGATWHHRTIDTGTQEGDSLRPITPRGRATERDALWMQGRYHGYTDYQTDVLAHFAR